MKEKEIILKVNEPKNSNDVLKLFIEYGERLQFIKFDNEYQDNILHFLCEWNDFDLIKMFIDQYGYFKDIDKNYLSADNCNPISELFYENEFKDTIKTFEYFLSKDCSPYFSYLEENVIESHLTESIKFNYEYFHYLLDNFNFKDNYQYNINLFRIVMDSHNVTVTNDKLEQCLNKLYENGIKLKKEFFEDENDDELVHFMSSIYDHSDEKRKQIFVNNLLDKEPKNIYLLDIKKSL